MTSVLIYCLFRFVNQQAKPAAKPAAAPPRFEIKKWNAVAMWSWDICADTVRQCTTRIVDSYPWHCLTLFSCILFSAPFAVIPSTNHPLNTKPIPLRRMTMVCPLPLEIAATSFTWIASSVGWRHGRCVHSVTRNGILPRYASAIFLNFYVPLFRLLAHLKILFLVPDRTHSRLWTTWNLMQGCWVSWLRTGGDLENIKTMDLRHGRIFVDGHVLLQNDLLPAAFCRRTVLCIFQLDLQLFLSTLLLFVV